jgi:hypothetical protein
MQHLQDHPAVKDKDEGEKDKALRKFKRIKRDEKKPVGERGAEMLQKKRKGEEEEMDIDGLSGVKKSKRRSSVEKESESKVVAAGLSEQPCGSQ